MKIDDLMTAVGALVGVVVWLVRLEGRIGHVEKLNENTDKKVDAVLVKHEALDSKIVQKLSELSESLARIEGRLGLERE